MKITSHLPVYLPDLAPSPVETPALKAPARPDVYLHGRLADLNAALDAIPPIRPEAVALGRQLAADPHYPGPVVLEHLAALFAADALS